MFIKNSLIIIIIIFLLTNYTSAQDRHRLLFAEAVHFASGKSNLQSNFYPLLQNAAKVLKEYDKAKLVIHAHTDSVGSFQFNEALAAARALAVERYLEQIGVDTARMEIRSFGEYSPLADDGTDKGRAENRRVMVYAIEPWDANAWVVQAQIRGRVVDAATRKPLNAKIILNSLLGKDTLITNEEGEFKADFGKLTNVEVRVYSKGYFYNAKIVTLKNKECIELPFLLEKALLGGKMSLNDLYFKSGTAILLPSSEVALQGVLSFLQLDETIKLEIGGHMNRPKAPPVDTTTESFKLSENRARAVYDYLIERGIVADRLKFKGYGNWEMIYPEAETELQQQANRRVELKVVD